MTRSPFDDMPQADLDQPPMVRPPIPMILFCPRCGLQHIDEPDTERTVEPTGWTNPPHRSHLCGAKACGHIWRPADVPTMGVKEIATKGANDSAFVVRGRASYRP